MSAFLHVAGSGAGAPPVPPVSTSPKPRLAIASVTAPPPALNEPQKLRPFLPAAIAPTGGPRAHVPRGARKTHSGPQPTFDRGHAFVDHSKQLFASRRAVALAHPRGARTPGMTTSPWVDPNAPPLVRRQSTGPSGEARERLPRLSEPEGAYRGHAARHPALPGPLDRDALDGSAASLAISPPPEDGIGAPTRSPTRRSPSLHSSPRRASFRTSPGQSRSPVKSSPLARPHRPKSLRHSVSSHFDLHSIRGSLLEEALRPPNAEAALMASTALGTAIARSPSTSVLNERGGRPLGDIPRSSSAHAALSTLADGDEDGEDDDDGDDHPNADAAAAGDVDGPRDHLERFVTLLEISPLFASLSRAELEAVCAAARYSVHARNHVAYREGAPALSIGVLLAGGLEVRDHSGREEVLERRVQQSTAPPLFGLEGCGLFPRLATARARTDGCAVMMIPRGALPPEVLGAASREVVLSLLKRTRELEAPLTRSAAARAALAPLFKPVKIGAGEVLTSQGEPADALFVLVAGTLDVRVRAGHGAEVQVGMLETRHDDHSVLLGETVLHAGGVRTSTVVAREPSWLLRMDSIEVPKLAAAVPELLDALAEARSLRDAADRSKVHVAEMRHEEEVERALAECTSLDSALARLGAPAVDPTHDDHHEEVIKNTLAVAGFRRRSVGLNAGLARHAKMMLHGTEEGPHNEAGGPRARSGTPGIDAWRPEDRGAGTPSTPPEETQLPSLTNRRSVMAQVRVIARASMAAASKTAGGAGC